MRESKGLITFAGIMLVLSASSILVMSVIADSGCCSWHGGEAGCTDDGHTICGDGTISPSCTCAPLKDYWWVWIVVAAIVVLTVLFCIRQKKTSEKLLKKAVEDREIWLKYIENKKKPRTEEISNWMALPRVKEVIDRMDGFVYVVEKIPVFHKLWCSVLSLHEEAYKMSTSDAIVKGFSRCTACF
jgi:hypothetical protein